ncbi:MAG: hypothetical protein CMA48_03060 [Euryarchaeota archaeon]|nr:hypothetical protein [Euryarchaeota archaeon]MBN65490.1 hypothetical protein [Euryarchaeota archaeon]
MVKLPVCFESRTTAASFRKLLDKKEFNYKRTTGSRTYTKVSFVIAHEKSAMVYKYDIENSKIKADIWEENPSSGNITYIEIESEEKKLENELLKDFALSLPRKPWEYTITQKLRNGWFSQGIFRAKSKWENYLK